MKKEKLVLPCLRAVVGDWVYYSSVMTPKQIFDWVMPVKEIRESQRLDEYLQRDLKDDKKKKISKYLLNDKQHFFNSIIIGIFGNVPDWVELDFNNAKYKGKAIMSESDLKYASESSGLMVFNGEEQMFALDGQHRVEGIKLALQESEGKDSQKNIADDQFSVIFVGHIDDVSGKKRSRKLFSDINKNAKPVGRVDKIKIDEEDINAIISRRIFAEYKHFKDSGLIALSETSNLEKNDIEHFANLATLDSVCKKLKKLYKKEKGIPDWDERNVEKFYVVVKDFYDFIIENIPEYNAFFISKSITLQNVRKENKYYLFRPIGIKMLAMLYVSLHEDLNFLKINLPKINFVMPESPLNKVVWTRGKMSAASVNQTLAFNLVLYLLGKYPSDKLPELKQKYMEITKQDTDTLPPKVV
jgi:DNA sulfur modification protein DndB